YPYVYPADPTERRDPLPPPPLREQPRQFTPLNRPTWVEQQGEIEGAVRTAIAVEPRNGKLCVFMPPVERLEDYIELLEAAEAAARELDLPIQIEGYAPPHDWRLNVIRVAPDPGVIEVNIHPSSSWRESVAITQGVYEDARFSRLGADKFMLDGR